MGLVGNIQRCNGAEWLAGNVHSCLASNAIGRHNGSAQLQFAAGDRHWVKSEFAGPTNQEQH